MVKQKDPERNFFDVIEEGSRKIAKCKVCKQTVSAKIERLKAHRLKCVVETECLTVQSDTPSK